MRTRLLPLLGALALLGCGSTGPDRPNGTVPSPGFIYPATILPTGYQASVADRPGVMTAGVRFTNLGDAPATIEHGACSVAVWLYRDDQRDSPPIWQNLSSAMFCNAVAYQRTLARGEAYDVPGATLDAQHLGLPNGRYLVRVAITRHDAGSSSAAEVIVLDAGTIALVR